MCFESTRSRRIILKLKQEHVKENSIETGIEIADSHGIKLSNRSVALLKSIEAQPGAVPKPMTPPRGSVPNVLIYKVKDKIFAIMSIRGTEAVILKCDPDRALFLREQYKGIGHRSHLDPRNWISVKLDSDVPADDVERLVIHSYEQVCLKLTKKQRAELRDLLS